MKAKVIMNYSYLMGIKDISELRNSGFIIEEIDGDFGVMFPKGKEKEYEEFIIKNLEIGYWNEYLGENFVFIFKFLDNSVKKYIYNEDNKKEILSLCCEFAEYNFSSVIKMLKDNSFYLKNYFDNKEI